MAHEISFNADGTAQAMYAFEAAWHGLGQVLDHAPDSAEAIRAAHLDIEVRQTPVKFIAETWNEEGLTEDSPREWSDFRVNYRADDGRPLGIVSKRYQVIQNTAAFSLMDQIAGEGGARFEAAGALFGMRKVWLLARFPEELEVVPHDLLRRYILLVNSHDGSGALEVCLTNVRVVCNNTLTAALNDRARKSFWVAHTGSANQRVESIHEALGLARATFEEFAEDAKRLASVQVDADAMRDYAMRIWPSAMAERAAELEEKARMMDPRPRTASSEDVERSLAEEDRSGGDDKRTDAARAKIRVRVGELFTDAPQLIPGVEGTAWAAFNAVTQYVDHEKRLSGEDLNAKRERRMVANMLPGGVGTNLKARALSVAKELFLPA